MAHMQTLPFFLPSYWKELSLHGVVSISKNIRECKHLKKTMQRSVISVDRFSHTFAVRVPAFQVFLFVSDVLDWFNNEHNIFLTTKFQAR